MIIGGTNIKEWKLKSNKKRIPEYFIKDHKFIHVLINEVGNYVKDDPVSCLSKLKEKAWEIVPLWKNKEKEAHLFKELWKLQTIIKHLAKTRILRKISVTHSFSSLELELLHIAAIGWNGSQDDKKRIKEKKSFKFKGFQVFYDGSRFTNPHLGGAGFAVFRKGKEIYDEFETIPLRSNNIGEFIGWNFFIVAFELFAKARAHSKTFRPCKLKFLICEHVSWYANKLKYC